MSSGEGPATAVAGTLVRAYRLVPAKVEQIHAGTATANFRVTDELGQRWFAKVYCDNELDSEQQAVELAEFARSERVPVPSVHRTVEGELLEREGRTPMSLWEYVGMPRPQKGAWPAADGPASVPCSAISTSDWPGIPPLHRRSAPDCISQASPSGPHDDQNGTA